MENILEVLRNFLNNYERIVQVVEFLFFAILSVMLFKKTGNINYLTEVLNKMKYRTEDYKDGEKVKGQTFSNLKPIKRLNKATGLLEETGEFVDIDELVVSSLPTILDNILDRFLPTSAEQSEMVVERDEMLSDIDFMQDAFLCAEEYRQKYGLPADMSTSAVFEYIKKQSEELNQKILDNQKIVKTVENIKKGVEDNEKKTVEESKQEEL